MSDSPPERDISWSTEGVEGAWRHLNRGGVSNEIAIYIKKYGRQTSIDKDTEIDNLVTSTQFIESFFNKAIAKIYELTNFLAKDITVEQKFMASDLALLMEPFTLTYSRDLGNDR